MSSNATNPSDTKSTSGVNTQKNNASPPLSKGKTKVNDQNTGVEDEDDDEDEEEEMGSDEEGSDEEAEEDFEEIDPKAIIPQGRRTRGVRVDYTTKEALARAGLQNEVEDEDSGDDVDMKD